VNLYDEIDFICPYAPFELDESQQEFYIIYQVRCQQVVLRSFRLLGYLVFLSSGKEVQNLRQKLYFTNDSGDKSESFDGDIGEYNMHIKPFVQWKHWGWVYCVTV